MNAEDALTLLERGDAARLLRLWEEERWSLKFPEPVSDPETERPLSRQESFPGTEEPFAGKSSPDGAGEASRAVSAAGPEDGEDGEAPLFRSRAFAAADVPDYAGAVPAADAAEELTGGAPLPWEEISEVPETVYRPLMLLHNPLRERSPGDSAGSSFDGQASAGQIYAGWTAPEERSFSAVLPERQTELFSASGQPLPSLRETRVLYEGVRETASPEKTGADLALTADDLLDELERRLLRQIQTETEGYYR
ncbi:MAG: hypothetical protein PUC47_00955 [Oscillospiraceae bacterium]|nr:hypothetical protein [Oscillospiraceae bacterium]